MTASTQIPTSYRRHELGTLRLDDHTLTVPLTSDPADSRTIDIFARVATRVGGEDLPYLVFLQGGPGNEAPRPALDPASPAWLPTALERYRVVMLDQRGTGRSTPVGADFVTRHEAAAAEYLTHLRADGIVRDLEALRIHLGVDRWNLLGQSFGGFTTLHYLTRYPEALDQVYITGGLSAVGRHCDEVYSACYDLMADASEDYYRRFPDDRAQVARLVDAATAGEIVLPDGEVVSRSRLRSIGMALGGDHGWFALHSLLQRAPDTDAFRYDLAALLPFPGRNPLYFALHESSYADGITTGWSAERVEPQRFRDDPTLLTGEHVRSDWLDTVPALQPWTSVATTLADHPWPSLYDADALRDSGAAGAAAIYAFDRFVPMEFSLETARLMPGIRPFVTSAHEHSGLRTSNGAVLQHLFDLADGTRVR